MNNFLLDFEKLGSQQRLELMSKLMVKNNELLTNRDQPAPSVHSKKIKKSEIKNHSNQKKIDVFFKAQK